MIWLMEILKICLEEQLLLCDKAFLINKNPKYVRYQRGIYSFSEKQENYAN